MAAKQQSRQRRSSSQRSRGPRHVEPVLDPTWQSPYAPSAAEREANEGAFRRYLLRRVGPLDAFATVVFLAGVTWAFVSPLFFFVPLLVAGAYVLVLWRTLQRAEAKARELGATFVTHFPVGGTPVDRQRLTTIVERLSATFGLDHVTCLVVDEPVPNAALVRDREGYALVVTSGLMDNAELIELEGVVAHCMARQRLGLVARRTQTAALRLSDEARRTLAGPGQAFRADEVAAAAIRYPLGLAAALRRTGTTSIPPTSYFATPRFHEERWVWFDPHVDGRALLDGDLDAPLVRAQALEEW